MNCSLPLIPSKRNQKLQFIYPNQNCLTDILNKSGYENFVIQGTDGRFANQEKLYLTHSVDNKNFIDKRKIINDNLSSWGYHDETIFAEAKSIIKKEVILALKKTSLFRFSLILLIHMLLMVMHLQNVMLNILRLRSN